MGSSEERKTDSFQDIVDLYKKDVDQTLLEENLKLTPQQRFDRLIATHDFIMEMRAAMKKSESE